MTHVLTPARAKTLWCSAKLVKSSTFTTTGCATAPEAGLPMATAKLNPQNSIEMRKSRPPTQATARVAG